VASRIPSCRIGFGSAAKRRACIPRGTNMPLWSRYALSDDARSIDPTERPVDSDIGNIRSTRSPSLADGEAFRYAAFLRLLVGFLRSQSLAPTMSAVPTAAIRIRNEGSCKTYRTKPAAAPPIAGSEIFMCLASPRYICEAAAPDRVQRPKKGGVPAPRLWLCWKMGD